jgi:hypothetical protein
VSETISLIAVVRDAADRLPEWIRRGRAYADEIVVGIDSASTDGSWQVARELADVAAVFEHAPCPEDAIDWTMRQARGDWILRLDDDESLSRELVASLPALTSDRHLTHYYIPRRWLVRRSDGHPAWLATPPWNPEWALRLHRNVGSIWRHEGGLHGRVDVDGEGRFLAPEEGVIWHFDLAWRSREQREDKVRRRYDVLAPWIESAPLYLWEDSARPDDLRPVSAAELDGWSVEPPAATDRPAEAAGPDAYPVAARLLELAQHRDDPPVFAATYVGHDVPARVEAGRARRVEVTVRNESAARWRNTGKARGRVTLSQGWGSENGGAAASSALLPASVERGESVRVPLALYAPSETGRNRVVFDLVAEGVASFSTRGVEPLVVDVEVVPPSD